MAFAAVNSLLHTINDLLDASRISVASSTREILQFAYDHASSLLRTIENNSEGVTALDEQIIIEEARKLEDAIEFPISTHFLVEGCPPTFSFNLDQLRQDVDFFAKTVKKTEESIEELFEHKTTKSSPEENEEDVSSATEMVGLSDVFLEIRDELAAIERVDARINIRGILIWISGMAGTGKTMLAKKVFHDPSVLANFECSAFVRVGHEFRRNEMLQAITAQLNLDNEKMIVEGDEDFDQSFSRILTVKKSLIVLDDVWEDIFNSSYLMSEIEDSGTRIMVTSRTDAIYPRFCIKIRFLNEEESWELLMRNVFGEEEECSEELKKPGKKIAEKCGGLPLLIIAVADVLLSKVQKNLECWNRVAQEPNSVFEDASDQISEVLLSSYHRISEVLKLCFLYIAVFPQNYIVRRSTIIKLWFAEGFQHVFSEDNFKTLCYKNLSMGHVNSWSSLDEIKACSLHVAYWYMCKRVAENNKFLYIINSDEDSLDECVRSHRRLAIYKNVLFAINEVHNKIASISSVRSLLCRGPYHQYQVPICWEWKLLKILDALTIRFYEFPVEVVNLIRLKYLALTCNANLPPSISKLWSLQFLIVHQHLSIKRVAVESYVPVEIWDMQELIHLEIVGRNLPDPPSGVVLPNLTKLLDVGVESFTKEILESIPKLKKLRIQIEAPGGSTHTLDRIPNLHGLYSFQSVIMNPTLLHPPPPLLISLLSLKKLSLSGFGYPWEDMSKIGALPNLEKLKLECYAFRGEKWEAREMRFSSLNYLLIEDTDLVQWSIGDETFPTLWCLTMKNCYSLEEIPLFLSEFEVDIELIDCSPLAETCAKQRNNADSVDAKYSWN